MYRGSRCNSLFDFRVQAVTTEHPPCFSSYTRSDSDFVLNLAKDLRSAGADLWLDHVDITGGKRWDLEIERAVESCEDMIVVLSPQSVNSENVRDAVSYVLENQKLIIPVLYRDCKISFRLRRVQYVDCTADCEEGFRRLLRAMAFDIVIGISISTEVTVSSESLPQEAGTRPKGSGFLFLDCRRKITTEKVKNYSPPI